MRLITIAALGAAFLSCPAMASDKVTSEEAKALLAKAIAHYQEVGREAAFKDFADKKGPYVDRDLYIWCMDKAHIITHHTMVPPLVGKSGETAKDAEGKVFSPAVTDEALAKGTASVDYKYSNPVTKQIEAKTALAQKVSDNEVCAVGYYK